MIYYPTETRVTPLTTIRRERLLPSRGQVLVGPGEVVGAADVVARCLMPGEVHVVDVSRALGVSREKADKYIRKSVGDTVQEGETLAARGGLVGLLQPGCRSPVDGQVIAVRHGVILIEGATTTFELRAHIAGQVTNVMAHVGVVIATTGALIQGAWGSGGEAEGVLRLLGDSPQRPLRARAVDVGCHGTIIVGSWILDEEVLHKAEEVQVRGIVAGSANAGLLPILEKLPFPVMLTEGFGTLPMSQHTFSLLQTNTGREVMLSADTKIRWAGKRPELVIPLRAGEDLTHDDEMPQPLEIGARVRLLRAPHLGAIGQVKELPPFPQIVDSGIRTMVAVVELEDGETVLAPLANLDLVR